MSGPDGGPAYPAPQDADGWGMSLRDYFAGEALAGMLANNRFHIFGTDGDTLADDQAAQNAYDFADAMLAKRAMHDRR
jgi:hypothetical protein